MNESTKIATAEAEASSFLATTDDLAAALQDDTALESLLARVEAQAKAHVPDVTTRTGREAIKSNAFKVTRSKTAIEEATKALTEKWREATKEVNGRRAVAVKTLEDLRDTVRKPFEEWETAEQTRLDDLKAKVASVKAVDMRSASSEAIQWEVDRVEEIVVDETWQEYEEIGRSTKQATLAALGSDLATAKDREANEAELARLRAEDEARRKEDAARAQRMQRLDTLKLGATGNYSLGQLEAELARVQGVTIDETWGEFSETAQALRDAAVAGIEKAIAEHRAAAEKDRQEAEQRAAQAAREEAERAAQDRIAAAERAQQEAEERAEQARQAEARAAEEAVAAERKRAADAAAAAEADRQKREANKRVRAAARAKIVTALGAISSPDIPLTPEAVADAIVAGHVPCVRFEP